MMRKIDFYFLLSKLEDGVKKLKQLLFLYPNKVDKSFKEMQMIVQFKVTRTISPCYDS